MQAQAAELQLTDAADMAAVKAMSTMAAMAAPALERQGCGWFDSSYELGTGLLVIEQQDDCLFQLWSLAQGLSRIH